MQAPRSDVETIFEKALAIDVPQQREAYLVQACAGDAAIRSRVEQLLRANAAAGSFLEQPPAGLTATIATGQSETADATPDDVPLDFLAPSPKANCLGTLGQYEAVEVVGRGGMGIVLRAYDTKLNRVVAIKAMAPGLASNAMGVKRFLREARAAAAVSHDHLVTIFAIEETHQPPFIVMEFVAGQSLQEKLDQCGALELTETLRIGMQVARGLAAAHEQGLVHRDIKPANILLENGIERVKLTDFGLARAVDDVSVTQTGQIAGTPQYMSAEQALGQAIDARSDLFSLGSVLYAMCTGRPPFRADNAMAVLRRVADDTPRPIHEVNPAVPAWLEATIFKLLAKDPRDRFQSADEVAEVLGQYLARLQHPEPPASGGALPPIRHAAVAGKQPSKVADPQPLPSMRVPIYLGVLASVLLAGLAVAAIVLYLVTDKGTLIVETNDAAVPLAIKDDRDTIVVIHPGVRTGFKGDRHGEGQVRMRFQLRSGTYRFLPRDDESVEISQESFLLRRGGQVVVRVRRVAVAGEATDADAGLAVTEAADNAEPESPPITEVFDEMVALAEANLQRIGTLVENGVVSTTELHQAEAGLLEMKIRRAEALDDVAIVRLLLQELIAAKEKEVELAQVRFRTGEVPLSEVQTAMKGLLDAKAKLSQQQ